MSIMGEERLLWERRKVVMGEESIAVEHTHPDCGIVIKYFLEKGTQCSREGCVQEQYNLDCTGVVVLLERVKGGSMKEKGRPMWKQKRTDIVNPHPKGEVNTEVIKEDKSNWVGKPKRKKDDNIRTYNVRRSHMVKENTVSVNRGAIPQSKRPDSKSGESVKLFVWDKLSACNSRCRIFNMCELQEKAQKDERPVCLVMKEYLSVALNVLLKYNDARLDDALSYRIGMHLMPLYRQLFRLKILEVALADPMYSTKQGMKIHPVFKEIRETVKEIEKFWKEQRLRGPLVPDTSALDKKKGDVGYYEKLEDGELETPRKKVRMLRRKIVE